MNDTTELISVVMCTRNRADLIGQAVASVLASEYRHFELTIVDQSDDSKTEAIVGGFADDRVHYIHTPIAGLSRAYNIGIRASQGSLIAFTDDDCVVPTDWISTVERTFREERDVDLAYGQVICAESLRGVPGVVPELRFPKRERIGRGFGFRVVGMGANFAARASFFRSVGEFDETLGGGGPLRSSQDYDLQFRAFRKGAVTMLLPELWVYHYGLREEGQWSSTLLAYGTGDGGFYMKHARCGDLRATWLLSKVICRQTAALLVKPLLGRRHDPAYLKGLVAGSRASFRYRVDRPGRTYVG